MTEQEFMVGLIFLMIFGAGMIVGLVLGNQIK